ncbi:MAG TPA: acyl-CoA dehydrogenase family protein [Candidatus Binataceae bacterium]|nr:acyl-CoA dehydrogenase family protein [Candidatus Binataceae bacterium]
MDFTFNDQERQFAESLRRFARERLAPDYATWDRGTPFPRERIRELAEIGIAGLRVPEAYGGAGASYVMAGIASEELSRGDYNTSLFLQIGAIGADIIAGHAIESVKRTWLPAMAKGKKLVAFALTEPNAGSDAAAITTSARRDGDCYVLSGEKASITFAGLADACIVFARTGGPGAKGIGALLVPLDLAGVSRQIYRSAGERLTQRGSLTFDGVRVPADHLIGGESGGFYQAMGAFDYNRAIIALACVGVAQQSLDETVEYAKQRHTFGRPIAKHEGVAFQIAEHLTMISAARLLAYQCLTLRDRGEPHTKEAAMAKWLGPKAAAEAIHACIVLHGWIGYSQDLPFEQRLRDVIGLEIGDGTPEIMKSIIARETFGREFAAYR